MLNRALHYYSKYYQWKSNLPQTLSQKTLNDLFTNKISSIYLKNFATKEECNLLHNALSNVEFDWNQDVDSKIGTIGVTQLEGLEKGKEWYFKKAQDEREKQRKAFAISFDPIERLKQMLYLILQDRDVKIAQNNEQSYFAGLIKKTTQPSLLQAAYAPYDAYQWNISNITAQLSWNFCLVAPEARGETIVYNCQWDLNTDEKYRKKNSYGYDRSIVENCESSVIKPSCGDSYFFNSRNFNEVHSCRGDRLFISCFVGLCRSNEIIIWS